MRQSLVGTGRTGRAIGTVNAFLFSRTFLAVACIQNSCFVGVTFVRLNVSADRDVVRTKLQCLRISQKDNQLSRRMVFLRLPMSGPLACVHNLAHEPWTVRSQLRKEVIVLRAKGLLQRRRPQSGGFSSEKAQLADCHLRKWSRDKTYRDSAKNVREDS